MPNYAKLIKKINWYPPYLAAGIRVKSHSDDFTRFTVQMKQAWYNRNLFGTHFGGSMYSMSDPFFVFILVINLGKEYIVWDKAASIKFLKPGTGTITVDFFISPQKIIEIRHEVAEKGKNTYHFQAEIKNQQQEVVAVVDKEVYVRKKKGEEVKN